MNRLLKYLIQEGGAINTKTIVEKYNETVKGRSRMIRKLEKQGKIIVEHHSKKGSIIKWNANKPTGYIHPTGEHYNMGLYAQTQLCISWGTIEDIIIHLKHHPQENFELI